MDIVAVILAGGEGKRCWPLTTSKSLFSFFSTPIIKHTYIALKQAGFSKTIIITSRKDHKQVKDIFHNEKSVQIIVQKAPKGMADSVLTAEKEITGKAVFILNAHDFVEQKLFNLALKHSGKKAAFIIAKKQETYEDVGYLSISKNKKKLTGIIEKPGKGREPSNFVNLVFHYFPASITNTFLKLLKQTKSQTDDIYEKAFTCLIKTTNIKVLPYKGFWQPLKLPWHILDMSKLLLERRLETKNNSSQIAKSATIDKNVFLGKGVRVLENAVVKGPSYIGENTIIGTNALVLESMIGNNCVVGFGTEVARSYLGEGCWLHSNYVGDSILEANNYFGAGAVTANFRFDAGKIHSEVRGNKVNTKKNKLGTIIGKNTRIGINVSLMPGVKIGSNSFIGPGVIQYKDVQSDTKVFIKQQTITKKNI